MKILYIKTGALGDIVQSCAAINHFKDYQVTWVVSKSYSDFLKKLCISNNIIEVNTHRLINSELYKRFFYLLFLIIYIKYKCKKIDLIIIGHSDWRYRILVLLFIFTKKRFYNSNRKLPLQSRNRIYEYFTLFYGEEKVDSIDLAQSMYNIGDKLIKCFDYQKGKNHIPKNAIVLVPGGSKNFLRDDNLRRWPIEYYANLASNLIDLGFDVVIIGSKDDNWILDYFKDLKVINLVDKLDLIELVYLFSKSKLVISHDTGPLHLAASTHVDIIAIFGPTSSNAVLPVNNPKIRVLAKGNSIACSPCYDGKNYAHCLNALCMLSISSDYVLRESLNILKNK